MPIWAVVAVWRLIPDWELLQTRLSDKQTPTTWWLSREQTRPGSLARYPFPAGNEERAANFQ